MPNWENYSILKRNHDLSSLHLYLELSCFNFDLAIGIFLSSKKEETVTKKWSNIVFQCFWKLARMAVFPKGDDKKFMTDWTNLGKSQKPNVGTITQCTWVNGPHMFSKINFLKEWQEWIAINENRNLKNFSSRVQISNKANKDRHTTMDPHVCLISLN
jgi:hypothetical protein